MISLRNSTSFGALNFPICGVFRCFPFIHPYICIPFFPPMLLLLSLRLGTYLRRNHVSFYFVFIYFFFPLASLVEMWRWEVDWTDCSLVKGQVCMPLSFPFPLPSFFLPLSSFDLFICSKFNFSYPFARFPSPFFCCCSLSQISPFIGCLNVAYCVLGLFWLVYNERIRNEA